MTRGAHDHSIEVAPRTREVRQPNSHSERSRTNPPTHLWGGWCVGQGLVAHRALSTEASGSRGHDTAATRAQSLAQRVRRLGPGRWGEEERKDKWATRKMNAEDQIQFAGPALVRIRAQHSLSVTACIQQRIAVPLLTACCSGSAHPRWRPCSAVFVLLERKRTRNEKGGERKRSLKLKDATQGPRAEPQPPGPLTVMLLRTPRI